MSNLKFCTLIFALLFLSLSACKKESTDVFPQDPITYADSVSFVIDGKTYIFNRQNGIGNGNRQINVKPYPTRISGREYQYSNGTTFWYGEKDSTLYGIHHFFESEKEYNYLKIFFNKKFHHNQLRESLDFFSVKVPKDDLALFKEGKQTFAVDLGMENTTEGIALEMFGAGFPEKLTSSRPGFSILVRPDLKKDLQNNSTFDIIKVQKISDKYLLVQAKFELNLYDEKGTLYRLEKGFIQFQPRIKTTSTWDIL